MNNDIKKFQTMQAGPCAYCNHWTNGVEAMASYALYNIRLCGFCQLQPKRVACFKEVSNV